VERQTFVVPSPFGEGKLELTNLVARWAPERPKRVLLGAHYDTRPWADREEVDSLRTRPIPGANDGASGVAVLLELARLVASDPPEGLGVDLVFFDGEDLGREGEFGGFLRGSKHFVRNWRGTRPRCAVVLDMVGGKDARFRMEANSLIYARDVVEVLFDRAAALGFDRFEKKRGGGLYDDHIQLLQAGIAAVDLVDLDYPHWHRLSDRPEACSRETLGEVGRLMVDFLYRFPF
jgi:hypothetical protein